MMRRVLETEELRFKEGGRGALEVIRIGMSRCVGGKNTLHTEMRHGDWCGERGYQVSL